MKNKKYIRKDGFRDVSFGYFKLTDIKTQKDSIKRITQKRVPAKKK